MPRKAESRMTIRRPAPSLDDPTLIESTEFEIDIIREADGTVWAADPQSGFLVDLTPRELQRAADILATNR